MRLSYAAAYAVRALVFLARHGGAGLLGAEVLAADSRIPLRFLRRALASLVAAGLLYAERGHFGGYPLARPAKAVTLLEIVEAVGGPVRGEAPRAGRDARLDARLQEVYDGIAGAVRARLRKVTLADLAGDD
jgi:Rrf2 family protein